MPLKVLMPAMSPTMTEGNLVKWLVKENDKVQPGDILAEIETDKATMEIESIEEGIVGQLLVAEGQVNIPINTPLATIIVDGIKEEEKEENSDTLKSEKSENKTTLEVYENKIENNPELSSPSFDSNHNIEQNAPTIKLTVRQALNQAIAEEMRRDEKVFIMGEEVAEYQGAYKITENLLQEFGKKRVVDTPITEHGFAGVGVGAAVVGLKPIVEFMTFNFAMQAIDQIINSAAKTCYMTGGQINVPIVFRGPNGAAARVAAQHSQDYSAWYASVPGLKVVMPYFSADAKGLLKSSIRDPNPVIFLENEILYGHSFDIPEVKDLIIPIGKGRIVKPGKDITLVSFGIGMLHALEAAENLAKENIEVEVIDLRTLRPLDEDIIIESVKKTNRCIIVEQGWPVCSMSDHISALLMEKAFDLLDAPVMKVTGKDVPLPFASNLEQLALPSTKEVIEALHAVNYTNPSNG